MPTYQYACTNPDCGNRFEEVQAFTDPSVTQCPICGERVRKVYGSVGVVFKGSGFYRNDSREGTSKAGSESKAGSGADSAGTSSGEGKSSSDSGKSGSDSGKSSSDSGKSGSDSGSTGSSAAASTGSGKSDAASSSSSSGGSGSGSTPKSAGTPKATSRS